MSDIDVARRAKVKVYMGFRDVSADMDKYLLSAVYTDSEDNETDDLQLTLQDRDGLWQRDWFGALIEAAVQTPGEQVYYTVASSTGLTVRTGPGEKYAKKATLPYGAKINTANIAIKWARISYADGDGYVLASGIKKVSGSVATGKNVDVKSYAIGDEVTVSGRPQYSSYGIGTPGKEVTNYTGKITYLNMREGIPYPVCVGSLGWFALDQIGGGSARGEVREGLKLQAMIASVNRDGDGKDRLLDCGTFELDSVKISGPPGVVTIKATSLPYTSTIRKVKKTRSWENYTLDGIAAEIAKKNRMTSLYLPGMKPAYARVEQLGVSDIAFLEKLCADAGFSLKVTNNIITVFERADDGKPPVKVITPETKYEKMSVTTGKDRTYTSCRVSYVTPSGKLIEGIAYAEGYNAKSETNEQLELTQKVASIAQATSIAEAALKKATKYALKAQFTFYGDTTLLAGMPVELRGWGALDGRYMIASARHTVGSGYTTAIELREA